jgi:hypothetical protein
MHDGNDFIAGEGEVRHTTMRPGQTTVRFGRGTYDNKQS